MPTGIKETHFDFKNSNHFYKGKVRDVYYFNDKIAVVTTDRISAFDVILPKAIPFKGQVLNQIAAKFLEATKDIVPNWVIATPHPNVTIGHKCEPYPIEMVIRGYLAGHAWREYKAGKRMLCGVPLPDGLKENDKLPQPIITPATKAEEGHDEDISREEIISQGLVPKDEYETLEKYTYALFERGTELAAQRGLILVDTKYEFGNFEGKVMLIDEIHTPDSSRYFYKEGYEERQKENQPQKQLSKEFVRKWLIDHDFQGEEGKEVPSMPDSFITEISERYIELYEKVASERFHKTNADNLLDEIETSIANTI